jgi:tRNA-specific 2-thiouridylase
MHTIAIALSGGTDSLMSLLLLRETGVRLMGLHARFLDPDDEALHERLHDVCARLGVPLECIDLRREFEDLVIAPFVRAYQAGLTPNPCATCNPAMKFGLLLDRALALGADRLATGHYARLEPTPAGPALFRGLDPVKDQSYFLSRVPRERFAHVLFPLASWTKVTVRQALAARGFTPPAGGESQEICFIPADYREFLRGRNVRLSGPGPIALANGMVLGRHGGLWNHTLGQRKGLGIAYREPLYVIAKDFGSNRLIVGPRSETLANGCRTGIPNLLCAREDWPTQVLVQTIYRQRPEPAHVTLDATGMTVTFLRPQPIPTPGQVAAVYSDAGQILAGAVIQAGADHAA